MNADYRLLIDNLLDLSHVSFLHRGLLRNEETENAEIQVQQASDSVAVTRIMRGCRRLSCSSSCTRRAPSGWTCG
jgi:vanillate O-demethylase monooxygenase subunit